MPLNVCIFENTLKCNEEILWERQKLGIPTKKR